MFPFGITSNYIGGLSIGIAVYFVYILTGNHTIQSILRARSNLPILVIIAGMFVNLSVMGRWFS